MTTRRRWTRPEMQTLRTQYGVVPARQIAAELNRTVDAIHRRAWEWCIEMPAANRSALTAIGIASSRGTDSPRSSAGGGA